MPVIDRWQPLSLAELRALFENSTRPFWVSGGWAIDLFLGKQTRAHADLDISIARADQAYFQAALETWDLQVVDPASSGTLRPWKNGEELASPAYNIWARRAPGGPWNLQIMLGDFNESEWVYRRNETIRGPLEEFGWTNSEGLRILSPMVQLFYKSRNPREKDAQDFQNCLPSLAVAQRERLRELILADSGENHPWLSLLPPWQ